MSVSGGDTVSVNAIALCIKPLLFIGDTVFLEAQVCIVASIHI